MKLSFRIYSILLFSLLACGSKPTYELMPRTPGNYEVSVKSGSEEVKNFERSLVHRVELENSELDTIISSMPGHVNVPFSYSPQWDIRGGVTGIKLKYEANARKLPDLGLRDGDLLTAVNKEHIRELRDLAKLVDSLRKEQSASMTLERNGLPHKMLYYLKP